MEEGKHTEALVMYKKSKVQSTKTKARLMNTTIETDIDEAFSLSQRTEFSKPELDSEE